jgi:hypothetical protein
MRKKRNAKGFPEREHHQYVLFPNIPVRAPSSASKVWHNNSIYHLLILGYFWINHSFWCNNSLHVATPPWFSSAVVPGLCSAKTIGAHFIVTTAMTQLFSPQQKLYTYTLQASASSMHSTYATRPSLGIHIGKTPTCVSHSIVPSITQWLTIQTSCESHLSK